MGALSPESTRGPYADPETCTLGRNDMVYCTMANGSICHPIFPRQKSGLCACKQASFLKFLESYFHQYFSSTLLLYSFELALYLCLFLFQMGTSTSALHYLSSWHIQVPWKKFENCLLLQILKTTVTLQKSAKKKFGELFITENPKGGDVSHAKYKTFELVQGQLYYPTLFYRHSW